MSPDPSTFEIDTLRPYIQTTFSTSSGPGGQNVNKVNTRVTLLLEFENCPVLPDEMKPRIRRRYASRLSADGRLRVASHRERSQARNRAAAEQRLIELLESATRVRKPRKPTKPTAGSKRRRLNEKRRRADIKRGRTGESW